MQYSQESHAHVTLPDSIRHYDNHTGVFTVSETNLQLQQNFGQNPEDPYDNIDFEPDKSLSTGTYVSIKSQTSNQESCYAEIGGVQQPNTRECTFRAVELPTQKAWSYRSLIFVVVVVICLGILAAGVVVTTDIIQENPKTDTLKGNDRTCNNFLGGKCNGTITESKKCWDCWGEWSGCSFTCGSGIRTRTRTCDGKFSGEECGTEYPTFLDREDCHNPVPCPSPFCPKTNDSCFYPHPNRCDLFIRCVSGTMYEFPCPISEMYRSIGKCGGTCDWAYNVHCSSNQ